RASTSSLFPYTTLFRSQSRRLSELGEGYLRAGRVRDAAASAARALALAEAHSERGNRAWALRLLAEVALHGDAPDLAAAARHLEIGRHTSELQSLAYLV